jgi:hypothetical protein
VPEGDADCGMIDIGDSKYQACLFRLVRNQIQPQFKFFGELAQLGERLVCNQEVTGSSPVFSTKCFRLHDSLCESEAWFFDN